MALWRAGDWSAQVEGESALLFHPFDASRLKFLIRPRRPVVVMSPGPGGPGLAEK
jgi:hypothetical protein